MIGVIASTGCAIKYEVKGTIVLNSPTSICKIKLMVIAASVCWKPTF